MVRTSSGQGVDGLAEGVVGLGRGRGRQEGKAFTASARAWTPRRWPWTPSDQGVGRGLLLAWTSCFNGVVAAGRGARGVGGGMGSDAFAVSKSRAWRGRELLLGVAADADGVGGIRP